eukprot:scaffold206_cov400-Prasinococcus_capsulatus_cf.AAC.5
MYRGGRPHTPRQQEFLRVDGLQWTCARYGLRTGCRCTGHNALSAVIALEVCSPRMQAAATSTSRYAYRPFKRQLPHDDELFTLGNIERELLAKQKTYQITIAQVDEYVKDEASARLDRFRCNYKGCRCTFTSLQQFNLHYNTRHRHSCSECGAVLPSNYLLDIHLQGPQAGLLPLTLSCGGALSSPNRVRKD